VSPTVTDLAPGSGIQFEGRAAHEAKGVPGIWQLVAARQGMSESPDTRRASARGSAPVAESDVERWGDPVTVDLWAPSLAGDPDLRALSRTY
jgi:hypothetical protein